MYFVIGHYKPSTQGNTVRISDFTFYFVTCGIAKKFLVMWIRALSEMFFYLKIIFNAFLVQSRNRIAAIGSSRASNIGCMMYSLMQFVSWQHLSVTTTSTTNNGFVSIFAWQFLNSADTELKQIHLSFLDDMMFVVDVILFGSQRFEMENCNLV